MPRDLKPVALRLELMGDAFLAAHSPPKRKRLPVASRPLSLPDDTPKVTAVIKMLTDANYAVLRPSPYQLKIGSVSYYPTKRTLIVDGEQPEKLSSHAALLAFLDQHPDLAAPDAD